VEVVGVLPLLLLLELLLSLEELVL